MTDRQQTEQTTADMVREFHEHYGLPIRAELEPYPDDAAFRVDLLAEEWREYRTAVADDDVLEVADALADMVYVIYGTALAYGIDLDAVLREVHRSNMSKMGINGKPVLGGDGKVLKGPRYSRPNIAAALGVCGRCWDDRGCECHAT